jgi:aminoglycoside phosphotransferase (APT) family kinase protein
MLVQPGALLGRYQIEALIGRGGMGQVYRARDTRLGREVALKLLAEAFSRDEERLARFEREAKVLASLNHPGIATLHGFERTDEEPFLVMELVEGETLSERIARGPLPLGEALSLFVQIAEALEAAHDKGVVHRDLKPANSRSLPAGRSRFWILAWRRLFLRRCPPRTCRTRPPPCGTRPRPESSWAPPPT